jgi:hypothetical protein
VLPIEARSRLSRDERWIRLSPNQRFHPIVPMLFGRTFPGDGRSITADDKRCVKPTADSKGRVKRHCPFEGHFALAPARTHDINQRQWHATAATRAAAAPRNHVLPRSGCQPTEQR